MHHELVEKNKMRTGEPAAILVQFFDLFGVIFSTYSEKLLSFSTSRNFRISELTFTINYHCKIRNIFWSETRYRLGYGFI